nr:unnamed protein product [Callosobruchus analis]
MDSLRLKRMQYPQYLIFLNSY